MGASKVECRCAGKCNKFIKRGERVVKCIQRTNYAHLGTPFTYHQNCFIKSAQLALVNAHDGKLNEIKKAYRNMDPAGVYRK